MSADATEVKPGRVGKVRGFLVSNARQTTSRLWGVRFGSQFYPNYATQHPTAWDGSHGGTYLTPDEADEMAEYLKRCAAWARAQQALEPGGA